MGDDYSKVGNSILFKEQKEWNANGSHLYPAIVINGKTLRGHLTPNNVFEALCAAFKSEPTACRTF